MQRVRSAPLPVTLVAAAAFAALSAGATYAGTIHPKLQEQMDRASAGEPISVIVNLHAQAPIAQLNQELRSEGATRLDRSRTVLNALQGMMPTQESLARHLDERMQSGGVSGYTRYWIANLVVVQATKDEIARLAVRTDVSVIEPNFKAELIEPVGGMNIGSGSSNELGDPRRGAGQVTPGVRAINADEVWYQYGINGSGRLIGSLDTGVDGNHVALSARWRGAGGAEPWQECWLDVLGTNTQFPNDGNGHGTHTTGTMAGLAVSAADTIGVAWGAKWISCNAINQGVNSGFDSDVLTALQWFMNPDGNVNTVDDVPDVVQNSWGINEGFGGGYTDCDTRWWVAMDNCEAAGVCLTWSAGNEGPGAQSLRSPADRATTLLNAFSVGAVDATNTPNFPFPIASFSSRGPSGCAVPALQKIKPEISAPGVDVYSSLPGNSYGFLSGTSMAGPHLAGVVALIREANPNLDVDSIKQLLIDTARDEGTAGEDNTYGWGLVDALAAVEGASVGFGDMEGFVTNASFGSLPLAGAEVKLVEINRRFTTDGTGHYAGAAAAGSYTAEASLAGFAPASVPVTLLADQLIMQDFSLTDIAGPSITNVTNIGSTTNAVGPYVISATIQDGSTVSSAELHYKINGGADNVVPMPPNVGIYSASIPGQPAGTRIDYYVRATDGAGLSSVAPLGAPLTTYTLYITALEYSYTVEDPIDNNWALQASGDNSTTGRWVRADPLGTIDNGNQIEPADDHTPNPGVLCFFTGQGTSPSDPGNNDVDNGCTTLVSPNFDLSDAEFAFVRYWRWYGMGGASSDDTFVIDVSSNGGTTWVALERVPTSENSWKERSYRIDDFVDLTSTVRFRFQACDINTQGLTEAAIDDFAIEVFTSSATDVADGVRTERTVLLPNTPNPARSVTTLNFVLSNPATASLVIFDANGRTVRTLIDAPLSSGHHAISWDGLDDRGREVGAGVYFSRLKAGEFEQSRRVTLVK
ncbi:MAG: S8 family serine peptidase [Candidatus Eisenbacteria bacterium]|nr:S8 family serine peptidase [Candidatus Eisenbacteria bacterium]